MDYFDYFLIAFQIIIAFFNISVIYFSNNKEVYIDIDNQISEYEENIDFSNYSTQIKVLALYLPENNNIRISNHFDKEDMKSTYIRNLSSKSNKNEHYERFEYNQSDIETFQNKINIAKSHGIYGMAIYYYWHHNQRIIEKTLDLFLNNQSINFNYMLIWDYKTLNYILQNENHEEKVKDNLENLEKKSIVKLIKENKEYFLDSRYIKINQKIVLGIYQPEKLQNLIQTISLLKKQAKEFRIGELFIIAFITNQKINYFHEFNLFDDIYEIPKVYDLPLDKKSYLNSKIIYNYLNYMKEDKDYSICLNNLILLNNTQKNSENFSLNYFTPEQFYMIIKIILEFIKKKKYINKTFFFINVGNEIDKENLLEPNKKYGYASLNSLSKALFDLSFILTYNLINLEQSTKIAIQAHVYYETLISDIIQKTNNIPVNFDLFISTDSEYKKENIMNYIVKMSNAKKFVIEIFNNKGRDVFPLLIQLKNQIKKYKYFCHIHTKKSKHIDFGEEWRNYLFNNLLGNKQIISEILTEFEDNINLGIIFPEIYYKVYEAFGKNILGSNLNYMESIIKKIAPYLRLSTQNLDFPMGNMFWAKIKSVYQIFQNNFHKEIPNENKQLDGTLMHGIERIWIYLAKYNGYYYKKIFKHL